MVIQLCLLHYPPPSGTYTDNRDGNVYNWIEIGNQIWMTENLAYLPYVTLYINNSFTEPSYYVYDYLDTILSEAKATHNYQTYGVMYNWVAARDACPTGWHIPSDEEWKDLEIYLGMTQNDADSWEFGARGTDEGYKLKAITGWEDLGNGSNESGFTALPGGFLYSGDMSFTSKGSQGYWWSSTKYDDKGLWFRKLASGSSGITRWPAWGNNGISVRCIKND